MNTPKARFVMPRMPDAARKQFVEALTHMAEMFAGMAAGVLQRPMRKEEVTRMCDDYFVVVEGLASTFLAANRGQELLTRQLLAAAGLAAASNMSAKMITLRTLTTANSIDDALQFSGEVASALRDESLEQAQKSLTDTFDTLMKLTLEMGRAQ